MTNAERDGGRGIEGRGKRPYKSREERRAEIVEATLAILVEEGLHAWTTAALARRVGVSEATLFRHFRDKDEILAEALRRNTEALRARITGYEGNGSAWEQLRGLVMHVLDFIEETGGGPLVILSGQALRVSPGMRREVQATRKTFHERLEALFTRVLTEAGLSRSRLEPEVLADLAVAVVHSSGLRWMMSEEKRKLSDIAAPMLDVLQWCVQSIEEDES